MPASWSTPRPGSAYRRRIEDLRSGVEDALDAEDDDRAARLQTELDELVAELARSFGLGGRDRRASSAAEKARLNVTRALRAALAKLIEALPEAGAALDRRIRTGTFCAYEPQADDDRSLGCSARTERDRRPPERLQGMEPQPATRSPTGSTASRPSCPRSRRRPGSPSTSS